MMQHEGSQTVPGSRESEIHSHVARICIKVRVGHGNTPGWGGRRLWASRARSVVVEGPLDHGWWGIRHVGGGSAAIWRGIGHVHGSAAICWPV